MNPALTADEAGYQQSDSGAAVVVVGDASAQVLAGSGARHLHVDDLAVMGEEPVALAALKEEHHRRAGVARLRQGAIGPLQASQGGPAHRALPRNAVGKVAKPELRERASSRRGGADSSPPRSGKHGTGDRARRPGKAAGDQRIRFVDVDGIRIRAAIRGEGRPLLLIMGIGGNIEMWRPFEGALGGSGIQTITFDAPGVGASTNWRRPRRMDALARTVDRLIGALGYEAVDVLGVSFGGALAQQLVRQSPARVRRLVLAATAPGMPGIGGVPGRPSALLTLATPLRYYSPAYFRMVAPTLYGGRIRREPELLAEQAHARMARPPSLRGYVAQLYAMAGWTNLPWLPFIHHPTLVMAGDDDPIIPLVNGRILARLMPLARLEVITGGGHLFLLEEAERSAALVREFLTQRRYGT